MRVLYCPTVEQFDTCISLIMMRLGFLILLVALSAQAQSVKDCVGNDCRVDNIAQDSVDQQLDTPVATMDNDKSKIYLDCNFKNQIMTIGVSADNAGTQTEIHKDVRKCNVPGTRNTKNLNQRESVEFSFEELTAGINEQNGNFEFSTQVCIQQFVPWAGSGGTRQVALKLTAACCLEPHCIPHPIIIPIIQIIVGVCKKDEWQMESLGISPRQSGFNIKPTKIDTQSGPIQYVKKCTVASQNGSPDVTIVDNGKLQHQNVLKSSGTYDHASKHFDFKFLTFVPSGMDRPIDWLSGNNATCPLIKCHFGYCNTNGQSSSNCNDFYVSTDSNLPLWSIKS